MELFLGLAACVWSFFGLVVLSSAKSVMHEILAAILLSAAVIFTGVAGIVFRLRRPRPEAPGVEARGSRRLAHPRPVPMS